MIKILGLLMDVVWVVAVAVLNLGSLAMLASMLLFEWQLPTQWLPWCAVLALYIASYGTVAAKAAQGAKT